MFRGLQLGRGIAILFVVQTTQRTTKQLLNLLTTMAKITVDIDDTLEGRIESAKASAKQVLIDWLENNTDHDPELKDIDLNELNCRGELDQIYDSATPVYNGEISDIWYLNKFRLEQAYEDAGCGDNPLENSGMTAIYRLIEQEVSDWLTESAETIVEEFFEPKIEEICAEVEKAYTDHIKTFPEDIGSLSLDDLGVGSLYDYVLEKAENRLEELQGNA